MLQIRAGDLLSVQSGGRYVLFAVLTKQTLFGGHWSFVYHGSRAAQPSELEEASQGSGFHQFVDFIVSKREGRIVRISRGNDFSSLLGPELLQQPPHQRKTNYHILTWENGQRESVKLVRFTSNPTQEEKAAPHYCCIQADFAFELAAAKWTCNESMWSALYLPNDRS